jgi:hypothetical protein
MQALKNLMRNSPLRPVYLCLAGVIALLPRCQNRQWEKEVAEKGHL